MKNCLLVMVLGLSACHHGSSKEHQEHALTYPVDVQEVAVRPVQYTLSAVGSVQAFENVSVSARVPGVIERVLFAEGDVVRRDQVLVEIELARYVLAVKAAQAALERAAAAKAEADAGLARRQGVISQTPGLIPGEELETWRTRASTLSAAFAQARVAMEQAELNLRDAHVRAPVDGVIQTRDAHTGQYVAVGTSLASLVRRDPLLVRFQVPEEDAARLHSGMGLTFHVRDDPEAHAATITYVAAAASETSRMVAVTARVSDTRHASLRPGAFAEVTVPIGGANDAPVVPQAAVRASERGFIAYVVSPQNTAQERQIKLGLRTADGYVEVRDGLKAGERLVVRGQEALQEGVTVRIAPAQALAQVGETP